MSPAWPFRAEARTGRPSGRAKTVIYCAHMKLLLILFSLGAAGVAQATDWYVDSAHGDNAAAGTSAATAVRSLARVNALDVKPGDRVLFKRGGLWRGTLNPRSGAEGRPVVYASYGEGPKPIIQNSVGRSRPEDWTHLGDNVWATRSVTPVAERMRERVWSGEADPGHWYASYQDGNRGSTRVVEEGGARFVRVTLEKRVRAASNLLQLWGAEPTNLPEHALLRLRARSTKPFRLKTLAFSRDAKPWPTSHVGLAPDVEIGSQWQTLDVPLTFRGDVPGARFHFSIGDVMPEGAVFDFVPVGIWRLEAPRNDTLPIDVGIFIVNHGEKWGWKKWCNPRWKKRAPGHPDITLVNDLDFWHDPALQRVCVKYPKNPGEAFDSIELALTRHIVNEGGCHDVVYDGLCVRYGGAHGFGGGGTRNIVIRNCDIYWIGGGLQFWQVDKKTGETLHPVRFGNGIEFWGACANNLVERNRLWQIYDAALTNQSNGDPRPEVDVTWRDNVIWQAEYSFEYWNHDLRSFTGNVLFEHNTCIDAGYCWSHAQRPNPNGAHLMFYDNAAPTTNFVVRNNLFVRTTDRSTRFFNDWRVKDAAARDGLEMTRNLYWIPENKVCEYHVNGRERAAGDPRTRLTPGTWGAGADEFARYQAEFALDKGSVYGEPQFVNEAQRDYRLKPGTLGTALAPDGGPLGARNMPGLDADQSRPLR